MYLSTCELTEIKADLYLTTKKNFENIECSYDVSLSHMTCRSYDVSLTERGNLANLLLRMVTFAKHECLTFLYFQ